MSCIIELSDISFQYDESKIILNNFSCRLTKGHVCALLGTNGAGKSTLLKIIARLTQPDNGQVFHHDSFFFIPQNASTGLPVSVTESVLIGRAAKIGLFNTPDKQDYVRVDQALEKAGISEFKNKDYSLLSGGEQQLVLLARALASGSGTLLFDEPFSAMDLHNQSAMLKLFKQLAKENHSILFSTHSPQHALTFADDVILMFNGGKTLFGTAKEILNDVNLTALYQLPMYCMSLPDVVDETVIITDFNY